ncbi:MAG: AAA family ATPase [Candidatus Diapherotrites archaeon]|nr:AAA family ATPase [Candidatus Diapherotrites archaeon]
MAELKELRLKNFKSFRKATIPFKKGFTAIIGPNGSGKSNILDSILFVLGSTSMKSLRAGRISNLINNSAGEAYGKAEIVVRDKDREWSISRTIDKAGKSTCRIDDQKKSLNEAVSLLNELGLKSDGNNIVTQGDITRIIEMNPEQRREIIDDLAGISEFDLKKEEAEKNLGKAEEKVKNTALVLNERLSRIEILENEKRAAEEYLKTVETKNRSKATILKLESEEAGKGLEEGQAKLKKLKGEADSIDEKIKKTAEGISETEKTAQSKEKELFEKREKSLRETISKIESLKGEKSLLLEKASNEKKRLAENSAREDALSKKLASFREESLLEKQRLGKIAEEIPAIKRQLKEVEGELGLVGAGSKAKESEISAMEKNLGETDNEIERHQKQLAMLLSEKSAAERQNSLAEKELAETAEKLKALKSHREKAAQLKERFGLLESKKIAQALEAAEKSAEKALSEEKSLEAKIDDIHSSLRELRREIAKCPVCDSDLSAQKKKQLVEKKGGEEKKALFEIKRVSSGLAEARKRKIELEKEQAVMRSLESEIAVLNEKFSAIAELEAKQKSLLAGKTETTGAAAKIREAEKALESLKAKRSELSLRLSSIKTDKKTIELNSRKSELESNLRMLESESRSISEKTLARIEAETESAVNETEKIHSENTETQKRTESFEKKSAELGERLEKLEKESGEQAEKMQAEREKKDELDKKLAALREKKDLLEADSRKKSREMEELRVESGKFEVRLSDLKEEFGQFKEFRPLEGMSVKELKKELAEAERKLEKIGPVNLKAAESLGSEKAEIFEVREKLNKLEEERNAILDMIQKIEVKRKEVFMQCFNAIRENFSKMFYNFFDGVGQISLTEPENPMNAGLVIEAKHKGENLQNIDSMSGGEKTLTALAFIFAIQQYDPAPFYFFDESDAALDEANSIRLTRIISEISRNSQFVAITHNNSLIKSANQIVGVTLDNDKSSVIGLNLKEKIDEKNSPKSEG